MRILLRSMAALGLISLGYVLGTNNLLRPGFISAQDGGAAQLSKETQAKIQTTIDELTTTQNAMQLEGFYRPAIQGVNSFAVTSGGLDAIADLESDRGVDPETFVGLYAGKAIDEVAAELSKDEKGRITYKNKVVRLYPVSRLKQAFSQREKIATADIAPE